MKKDKKSLIIGLIIGVLMALFYTQFFASRYDVKKDGLAIIKIDKWTGQSWSLVNNNWKKLTDTDQSWEEIDKTLSEAMKIPFAQVDSESALQKLRETNSILKDIPDEELLERIKLVYSKMVLVNMYLGEFLKNNGQTPLSPSQEAVNTKK